MDPPAADDLLALVRCVAGRARPGDAARAREAGLLREDGRPTSAGAEALSALLSLVERATRRAP